jgi:hypothetical protein
MVMSNSGLRLSAVIFQDGKDGKSAIPQSVDGKQTRA